MRRFVILLVAFMVIFYSCSQSPEKRRENLIKKFPNAKVLNTPINMTEDQHYMIWESDGDIYYSDLDNQDYKQILSKTADIVAYKCNLVLDANYQPKISLEDMDFDYLTLYNNNYIKYRSGNTEFMRGQLEVYGYFPRSNKLAIMEIGEDYYVLSPSKPNTLYCFDDVGWGDNDDEPLWTTFSYDLNFFDGFHDLLLKEKTWKKMADMWDCDDGYSITVWAYIKDNVEITLPKTFKYAYNEYDFNSFKNPQFLSELFNKGRSHYFKDILIPEWIKMSSSYKALSNLYSTNIIEASIKIPVGEYYLLYADFKEIEYADDPYRDGHNAKYKYKLNTFWYDDPMILYTDDDNFVKMNYPQYLWILGKFDNYENYGHRAIFNDAILFAFSPEYTDYPRAVVPYFLPAGL